MYSEGLSYMNIKFYNMTLSFSLQPFVSKDPTGKSLYNQQEALMTTVGWAGASAFWKLGMDIIEGKISKGSVTIPCMQGASLTLEKKLGANGPETFFTISKNGKIVSFRFETHQSVVEENGQMIPKIIETGLIAFVKTINSYLEGTNTDRHLDKFTDDYVKSLEASGQAKPQFQTGSSYQQNRGGYQSNYRKNNYNNNRRNYGNNPQSGPPSNQSWDTSQQNMSSYQLP
jgi:hypothetical protein